MLKLLLSVFFVNWMWPLFALLLANVSVGQVFNIEASEPMSFEASQFKAYENAWSVTLNVVNENKLLIVALCKDQQSHTCPITFSHFHMLTCAEMLRALSDSGSDSGSGSGSGSRWYNQYIADNTANNTQMLCNKIHSDALNVQTGANNILSDNAGGALVRMRPPYTLVLFNEQEVSNNWMTDLEQELNMFVRVTQIEVLNENFGVQHVFHNIRLQKHDEIQEGVITFSLVNRCTALGLSAPEFGVVRSITVAGRPRCVWDCREDMLREPYNSEPATKAQINTSSEQYSLLAIKYACVPLPSAWVATVFGFTVETTLATSDIGYAQSVFDAIDKLSIAVNLELKAQGILGIMIFAIKNSAYHLSFNDKITILKQAACTVANIETSECNQNEKLVTNPNYVYGRRRLSTISRRLLNSIFTEIEGIFISYDVSVFADSSTRENHLTTLRSSLVASVLEHSVLLEDDNGNSIMLDVEDIDFQELVYFELPSTKTKITNEVLPKPSIVLEKQTRNQLNTFGIALISIIIFLCVICILSCILSLNSKTKFSCHQ